MTDEGRGPLDDLLDLTLFLPLGVAAELRDLFPELTARGRQEMEDRLRNYRAVGELAVSFAQQRGPALLMGAITGAIERLRNDVTVAAGGPSAAAPAAEAEAADRAAAIETVVTEGPEPAALPIDGYDALSAVQVLPRLAGLTDEELALVERYEQAGRGRRTILTKIEQLRARSTP